MVITFLGLPMALAAGRQLSDAQDAATTFLPDEGLSTRGLLQHADHAAVPYPVNSCTVSDGPDPTDAEFCGSYGYNYHACCDMPYFNLARNGAPNCAYKIGELGPCAPGVYKYGACCI